MLVCILIFIQFKNSGYIMEKNTTSYKQSVTNPEYFKYINVLRYMRSNTFHLALAKFFSICAQTPSLMFLSEAAFPEILWEVTREHFFPAHY